MAPLLKKIILPLCIFVVFLLLYIHNLSRSVYGGDVGDLITAAAIGGVAHPPGYPLFTLLGFLLTHIPFLSSSPAFAVGLISAISASLGVACFYGITFLLTKRKLVAVLGALILGTSFLYWFYAEIAEVFALNAFFALFLFLLALYYRQSKKVSILLLFFFTLGMSFAHHQTIIFLLPSLLLLISKTSIKAIRKNLFLPAWLLMLMLLGFSPYVYVVIAASHHPVVNWDTVHDIPSFLHLLLRKDYGTFQAGVFESQSLGQRWITMQAYLRYLVFQLTIPVIALCLLGFWRLFLKEKSIFLAIVFAWILSGPFFLLYSGFPLTGGFFLGTYERFILLPFVISLIPFGMGLQFFSELLASILPKRHYTTVFQLVFLFIPLALLFYNFPKTNLSTLMIGDTYAKDFLDILPPHAILLISGDTQIFNTWYVHYVLHDRPDVLLYNLGAAPLHDNLIDPQISSTPSKQQFEKLIQVLEELQKTRPVFSTTQFQPKKGEKITWVPYGTSYRMFLKDDVLPTREEFIATNTSLWNKLHVPTKEDMRNIIYHNLTIVEIPTYYSDNFISIGTFAYFKYQDIDTALQMYTKARDIDPTNTKAYNALGVLYTGIGQSCNEIVANLTTSLSLDRFQEFPYVMLYSTYTNCLKDQKMADAIKNEFTKIFQKDFQKELESSTSATQDLQ